MLHLLALAAACVVVGGAVDLSQPHAIPAIATAAATVVASVLYARVVLRWGLLHLQARYALLGMRIFSLPALLPDRRASDDLLLAVDAAAVSRVLFRTLITGVRQPHACCKDGQRERRVALLRRMLRQAEHAHVAQGLPQETR
jgi:hypothetical protein